MSELDFDELDKAVNNLMSGVPKVEPPKTDDIKTLDISSTLPDDSRPPLDQLDSALTAVNGPAKKESPSPVVSSPAASLATRRSGRFMDVVHPSSDMKNTSKPMSSRQGVTIEPTAAAAERSNTPAVEEVSIVEESAPTHEPISSPAEHSSDAHSEWPDPLTMSGYETEEDTNPVVEDATEVAPVASDASNKEDDDEDDSIFSLDDIEETVPEPLTSPFISDAKVEKRPLGGLATETTSATEPVVTTPAAEEDEPIAADDPADQLPATAADVAPILPPELQKDLMAIETDGDTSAPAPTVTQESTDKVVRPETEAKIDEPAIVSEKEETEVEKPAVESSVPVGPASIPQQYKEEPSTGDQTNGGIYDTNNYHQPLAHPVKKKSGWLWIVWILLLLIIGGGGAAVLYLFNII